MIPQMKQNVKEIILVDKTQEQRHILLEAVKERAELDTENGDRVLLVKQVVEWWKIRRNGLKK